MNSLESLAQWVSDGLLADQTEATDLTFDEWLPVATPQYSWHWPHLVHIREHLDMITTGEIDRLMICIPPRHGKTEQVTVRYPVWRMLRDPSTRVILGGYNQKRANKYSRLARKIASSPAGIPDALNKRRQTDAEWETIHGGGVWSAGTKSGVTGEGADLIIIDDPIKSRLEANSLAYRDGAWDWYTEDIFSRREPGAAIINIMTRWHDDDVGGRIMNSEDGKNYTVVSLPALAEEPDEEAGIPVDPLGRSPGQALCPERFDEAALEEIRVVMPRSFHALYQQRPQALQGEFLERGWFKVVEYAQLPRRWDAILRYWDKAATLDAGDFTAGVLLARADVLYYILDVVRGQWPTHERERRIRSTAEKDLKQWKCKTIWIEQEPGSGGKDSALATISNLAGFIAKRDPVTGRSGKLELRAEPFAAQAGAGFVRMLRGPWNGGFLDEAAAFPYGRYDDQIAALAGGFNKLKKPAAAARSYQG